MKAGIIAVTSTNRIPYLQTKKADLMISSLGKNAERVGEVAKASHLKVTD